MNRKILFSPVGGTDPISLSNYRDGSLLHICRVYQPTDVYMYMSKEIVANHEKDNRYIYCLDQLAELTGRKMEYHLIQRENLDDVQDFDFFYGEFADILNGIVDEMDDSDELLLNVSSGTPAMKSGLLVLATMGDIDCKCIQVTTPVRKMNTHIHDGYDVEILWEADEDNSDGFENRCLEVKCPSLMIIRQEENIKKYLKGYDYQAALDLAKSLPAGRTKDYLALIEMAKLRLQLDYLSAGRIARERGVDVIPVKKTEWISCIEYALQIDIKRRKGDYGDFIRSISPILVDLFERMLGSLYGIDIDQFCSIDHHGVRLWDEKKLENTEVAKVLLTSFKGGFRYGFISSEHLVKLIEYYGGKTSDVGHLCNNLRDVEKSVRNTAAHEIAMMNDMRIRSITGFTSEEIMQMIKKCFAFAKAPLSAGCWRSYDDMNDLIISKI